MAQRLRSIYFMNKVINYFTPFLVCTACLFYPLSGNAGSNSKDPLARTQKMLSKSLAAQNIRSRVAAENMANGDSAGYIPKEVRLKSKYDKKSKTTNVHVQNIVKNQDKTKLVHDPSHPKADENGMVLMPSTDPLMNYMDLQKAKMDTEHIQKGYQLTTEMRHHTIKMMNQ